MASKSKPDKQRSVAQMLGWTGVAIVLVSLVNTGLMYRRWVSYEETERLILQLKGEVTVRRNAPELSWLDRWIGWHMTNALFRHPEELRITRGGLSSDQLAILHDLLREMSGIQKVDLGNDRLSEECWSELATRHRVRSLTARSAGLDPDFVARLSRLVRLKELRLDVQLREVATRDKSDFTVLQSLPPLEIFDLNLSGATDDHVRQLANLSELRSLGLNCENLSDITVFELRRLPKLQELMIRADDVQLHWPADRSWPASLESLVVISPVLDDESFRGLSSLPHLRRLNFLGERHRFHLSTHLGLPTSLGSLDLRPVDLDADAAPCLAALPNLRTITFGDCRLRDSETVLKSVASLPNLVQLQIDDADLTDEDLKYLSGSRSLKLIFLTKASRVSEKGLLALMQMPQWEWITFGNIEFRYHDGKLIPPTLKEIQTRMTAQREPSDPTTDDRE